MVGKIRRSATGLITVIFAFLFLISGAYCQVDTNEPNNALGDATEIVFGEAAGGYISPKGDADFYKFFVESPGILAVELSAVPDEMRTRIDFYGKNFNWITRTDASNPGDLATLKLDLANPGWYYVGISDIQGKLHNAEYTFQVSLEPVVDSSEPNNVLGDATTIDFGKAVKGYIFPKGDGDFYKFYVNSSGILEVKLNSVPDGMKARIDFYGKNFNWITRTDASNPGDLTTLKLDLANPGWYYVGISDLEGKSHNIEYAFQVAFEPVVDSTEPNSEIGDATEISFGDVAKGLIFPKGDGDFYKLRVDSPGALEVKLIDSPEDMKARIDLYGKNFNWIKRIDASNPGDLTTLKLDLADPGWYYLGITDLEGKSHNVEYSFRAILK